MPRRGLLLIISAFLIGSLFVVIRVAEVEASETIYIRADGSIDPPTANITSADNVTYTFIGNINESIVVERNNIVVDGAGYTLQGSGSGSGFDWSDINNVTIKHTNIKDFYYGIYLSSSSNNSISGNNITNNGAGVVLSSSSNYNTISGNNITNNNWVIVLDSSSNFNSISGNNITANNWRGIWLFHSSNNSISGNNITNNGAGIVLDYSSNNSISGNNITANNWHGIWLFHSSNYNTISENNIANNGYGIVLDSSSNSGVFHNNLINNTNQVYSTNSVNIWDDGYPSGGNFWSNYTGVDIDLDGIGDSNHVIASNNTDYYPLMGMFSNFNATSEHYVQTICNSTISEFQHNGTAISFNVTGENGSAGFCRITIPTALMDETYQVFVNGTEVEYNLLPVSNGTHSYLYFTYQHSTREVVIIPEFTSLILLPLFILGTLLAALAYRRRKSKVCTLD